MVITQKQAEAFVKRYFELLFVDRDIESLDLNLDPNYWDDDIGKQGINHIQNSKEYLQQLFIKNPTIGVEVGNILTQDSTITSYVSWFILNGKERKVIKKGIAIFEMKNWKIAKRHTYVYFEEENQ